MAMSDDECDRWHAVWHQAMAPEVPTISDADRIHSLRQSAGLVVMGGTFSKADLHDSSDTKPGNQSPDFDARNSLCNACTQILTYIKQFLAQGLLSVESPKPQAIVLDYNLRVLQESAELGCHLCSVLEGSTLGYILNGAPSPFEFEADPVAGYDLHLKVIPSARGSHSCTINLSILDKNFSHYVDVSLEQHVPTPDERSTAGNGCIPRSTNSSASMRLAARWLKDCCKNHDQCRPQFPPDRIVPKRLLHLISDTQIELVMNTGKQPYVCLSHCWGDPKWHQDLRSGDSLSMFMVESLPRTFRDAIATTRQLGMKYLFIDCFCIDQTSRDDWLEQSAVMAQIYANSVVTIAALSSKDAHGGCFVQRNPLRYQTLRALGLVVKPSQDDYFFRLEISGSRYESSPLHSRAWVVQERLAASRTLFYGSLGIYWECRTLQASETHSRLMDQSSSRYEDVSNPKLMFNFSADSASATSHFTDSPGSDQTSFWARWERLLAVYNECSLTHPTDKLIALAGITNDIQKRTGRKYVHGIWTEALVANLLWYLSKGTTKGSTIYGRPKGRLAVKKFSSWTWASTQGGVSLMSRWPVAQVTWRASAKIESPDDNADGGDVNPPRLRLKTWKRAVTLNEEKDIILQSDGSRTGDLDEDYLWYPDDDEDIGRDGPIWIALLERVVISVSPAIEAVRCLVLAPSKEGTGLFRRLGIVLIRFSNERGDPFPRSDADGVKDEMIVV